VALLTASVLASPGSALSQDAQYWTNQYGNRARLLAGSVIGSSSDLASVYYNPGALALVENPELLLAGNVFEYTQYRVDVASIPSSDLGSSKIGGAPSLFAGELKLPFLGSDRFAYNFLTRYSADIRIEERFQAARDDLSALPELAELQGSLRLEEKLTETWVGVTWATLLGERWGIGVSPYVTIRSQQFGQQSIFERVDSAGQAAISLRGRDIRFNNWRLLAKLGVSARYEPWRFGLTITTPSLNVWGSGSAARDSTVISQGGAGGIGGGLAEDVPADYRSPFSVGAGVGYTWHETTTLHVAAEYFAKVSRGEVLDLSAQLAGETVPAGMTQHLDDVLNLAVGLQHVFSERIEAYGGFSTDFSAKIDEEPAVFPISSWDIYHVSGGANFSLGRSEFTLGSVVAWGSGPAKTVGSTNNIRIDEALGLPTETSISYFRLTFILGFTILFD
jgi:hypothetical protein